MTQSISVDCVVKASPAFSGVEGGLRLARKEPLDDPLGPLDTRRTTGDREVRRRRHLGFDVLLSFDVLEGCSSRWSEKSGSSDSSYGYRRLNLETRLYTVAYTILTQEEAAEHHVYTHGSTLRPSASNSLANHQARYVGVMPLYSKLL